MTLQKMHKRHVQKSKRLLWGLAVPFLLVLSLHMKSRTDLKSRTDFPASGSLLNSRHESQESAPWIGVGLPPPNIADKHVRVVVRVHHLQDAATRSLIWSMRAQATAVTHPSSNTPSFTVDVVLVATEEQGIPVVHKIARDMWRANEFHHQDVFVAHTPADFFALAKHRSAPYRCTQSEIDMYGADDPKCAYDNHAFYQATDQALFDIIHGCSWCTHVLVTNSDNAYHPHFLMHMLKEGKDLVICDFVHKGLHRISSEFQLERLDLGGVVFSKKILQKVGGFIAALPDKDGGAAHAHDNDFHFVMKALEREASSSIVRLLIFSHN